ncbi:hypothetical protein [Methanosarcina sp.]|uniref:hypothetical protein n=1 Tax=Methanosarcina sp. TaxID=2213 RepID=UPI0029885ADC|nr:hypothetical protein [Methanosarcina sp.]MDW5550411.1 hypothetical protein [Methanosarcina sp.]MDW5554735.1 hypothetical protein [Methanosarcina sp.]MDW5559966.1 hypothetical protein [Methanosarcina sp.]
MSSKVLKNLLNPNEVNCSFILWSLLLAVSINFFSNILSNKYGDFKSLWVSVLLLILLISLLYVHELMNERKMKKLIDSSIKSRKIKGRYKGLIAFVSECKAKDKKEYRSDCIEKIKMYKISQDVTSLADTPSIGQTFKALDYHLKFGDLKHCWLIYSDQSGVNVDVMKSFFEIITDDVVKVHFVKIEDPNDSKHIKKKIDEIYDNLPDGVKENKVIADITAGNKPMTAAMVLSCLKSDRNLEYIEQSSEKTLIEVDISPRLMGVEL